MGREKRVTTTRACKGVSIARADGGKRADRPANAKQKRSSSSSSSRRHIEHQPAHLNFFSPWLAGCWLAGCLVAADWQRLGETSRKAIQPQHNATFEIHQ